MSEEQAGLEASRQGRRVAQRPTAITSRLTFKVDRPARRRLTSGWSLGPGVDAEGIYKLDGNPDRL